MRMSGRAELFLWHAQLRLRQWSFLRQFVRYLRSLAPDSSERQLAKELHFWRRWLRSEGLSWPEDYAMRFDPAAPVQQHLSRVIGRVARQEVKILDVGAGPVTVIGKLHPTKTLSITATDPLARDYAELLAKFAVTSLVPTIYASAESLRADLGSEKFDIVHAQNSLDHSSDPIAGIEEMLAVTKAGGFVVLLHEENEGKNELYYALHKWDFTCEAGHFVIAGPGPDGPRRDITEIVAGRADVECSVGAGQILVVMRKKPRSNAVL